MSKKQEFHLLESWCEESDDIIRSEYWSDRLMRPYSEALRSYYCTGSPGYGTLQCLPNYAYRSLHHAAPSPGRNWDEIAGRRNAGRSTGSRRLIVVNGITVSYQPTTP